MDKKENQERIESYSHLKKDWNGNGAEPLTRSLLEKAKNIALQLSQQPVIFPTARMSIQFEFETDVRYLEFEIWEDKVEYYYKDSKIEKDGSITGGIDEMEQWIRTFNQ